jgi:hypothetical protein
VCWAPSSGHLLPSWFIEDSGSRWGNPIGSQSWWVRPSRGDREWPYGRSVSWALIDRHFQVWRETWFWF